jgi:hypothetical protein
MCVALPPCPLHGVTLRHMRNVTNDRPIRVFLCMTFDSALLNNVSTVILIVWEL